MRISATWKHGNLQIEQKEAILVHEDQDITKQVGMEATTMDYGDFETF